MATTTSVDLLQRHLVAERGLELDGAEPREIVRAPDARCCARLS